VQRPQNLHALENDQVLLANPPAWTDPHLQLFSNEGQKLAYNAINERL